jgi:hypothetical protein
VSRRKDFSDLCRTRSWVEFCRSSLGVNSLYALEQRLEQGAFQLNARGTITHRNKWRRYLSEGVMPNRRLVASVETAIPGSSAVLNHLCWDVFRSLINGEGVDTEAFLRRACPGALKLLYGFDAPEHGGWRRRALREATIARLERRDDLDGIAVLSLLIVEAHQAGKGALAIELGGALFYALLRLPFSSNQVLAKVAPQLFDVVRERVFPFARSTTNWLSMERVSYERTAQLVRVVLESQEGGLTGYRAREVLDRLFESGWLTPVGFLSFSAPCGGQNSQDRRRKASLRICGDWIVETWDVAFKELNLASAKNGEPAT